MIKRVNSTGRRRIPRERIDIEVYDGAPRTFDAIIDLQGLPLLAGAAVFLEATCAGSPVVRRFSFGEVKSIKPPDDRTLREINGENVYFTLKVVDRSERDRFGRIVGIAEHIRPQRAGKQTVAGRRGILPIEPVDLGQELWQLEFRDHDVFLLVNKNVVGLVDLARSNPLFCAAVYPVVVRTVLGRAIAEGVEIEEDDDRWPFLWLRFGKNLHPAKEAPPKSDGSTEEREQWINDVVKVFCDTHAFRDKYTAADMASDGDES